jgi:hypothetical protein
MLYALSYVIMMAVTGYTCIKFFDADFMDRYFWVAILLWPVTMIIFLAVALMDYLEK